MKDEKTVITIVVAVLGFLCLFQAITLEDYHHRNENLQHEAYQRDSIIQKQDSTIQYYIFTYEND